MKKRFVPFGEKAHVGPKNISYSDSVTFFDLFGHLIHTNIFGLHNILNLSSAILMLKELDFDLEKNLRHVLKLSLPKEDKKKLVR